MEQTLGKRIMENRKRLGWTQDRLAEQMGVSAQAVSKWENDQSCPDISLLPKLAELFGITVDELLESVVLVSAGLVSPVGVVSAGLPAQAARPRTMTAASSNAMIFFMFCSS